MRIVNPTFGYAEDAVEKTRADQIDWAREPVLMFSNSKPNADELLGALATRIEMRAGLRSAGMVAKGNAAMPASPALLAEIASRHRVAILGLAD